MILCFDVGGTYIKYGLLENNHIVYSNKAITPDGLEIKKKCSIFIIS